MYVSDLDYVLPPELIAQEPLERRDASRMMVVRREGGMVSHARFADVPSHLRAGEVLVLNDTKVLPAKAWGRADGKDVEFLFVREFEAGAWEVLCRPAKAVRVGGKVDFGGGLSAAVIGRGERGMRTLGFGAADVRARLREIGSAPLPPYIKRRGRGDAGLRARDLERYQTVFAAREGAIAAPTAGLHFTPAVLDGIAGRGVEIVRVTLHVGLGTFQPIRAERLEDHRMGEEIYEIAPEAAEALSRAKREGRPIVAAGTTVVRALESAALEATEAGSGAAQKGEAPLVFLPGTRATSLFITPGFRFRAIHRLLTNFHLPRSTLLALAAAFAGRELILRAYREAVRESYRFYSYGDCMLII